MTPRSTSTTLPPSDTSIATTKPTDTQPEATPSPTTAKAPRGRGPRATRRFGTQSTTLEALDDSAGPLGPLGDTSTFSNAEDPPAPPQKENTSPIAARLNKPVSVKSGRSSLRGMMESVNLEDEEEGSRSTGPRVPPPVEPAMAGGLQRSTPSSVSVEQAAKPTFEITVGDPHKVGDLTSSHTVYQVRTKVSDTKD